MKLNLKHLIKGLGNSLVEIVSEGQTEIDFICTDSRELKKGQFFWPIKGEKFDGHKFIADAIWAGCSGFVFSDDLSEEEKTLVKNTSVHVIKVVDTIDALQKLGSYVRKMSNAKVIAVTGSNGKTTTKNLIASVLSQGHKTVYSQKSFNNHLGVPLTLLKIEQDTEFVVIEMGMNHAGEIKKLMEIAEPDIGVLVNVTSAHLGNFSSFEELVLAKGDLACCMKENGTVIFNHDLRKFAPFNEKLKCKSKEFGFENDALFCTYYAPYQDDQYLHVKVRIAGEDYEFEYPGLGIHNAENIACACACCFELGVGPTPIKSGMAGVFKDKMRMEKIKLTEDILLINDAYNANPASTEAAVRTLDAMDIKGAKHFVIGNMNELGVHSEKYHRDIGELISKSSIDFVYSFGEHARIVTDVVKMCPEKFAAHYTDKKSLADELKNNMKKNDVIMLKGSRANTLETLQEALHV